VSWKSPGNLLGWICRHPDFEVVHIHGTKVSGFSGTIFELIDESASRRMAKSMRSAQYLLRCL